jgi:hypothetical protein
LNKVFFKNYNNGFGAEICGSSSIINDNYNDGFDLLQFTFQTNEPKSLTVEIYDELDDDKKDESWGIREIEISIEMCSPSCKKCSIYGVSICQECYPNAILENNACKCRDGFFMENVVNCNQADCSYCKLCNIECKTCSTKSVCSSCRDGYTLSGDRCVLDGSKRYNLIYLFQNEYK